MNEPGSLALFQHPPRYMYAAIMYAMMRAIISINVPVLKLYGYLRISCICALNDIVKYYFVNNECFRNSEPEFISVLFYMCKHLVSVFFIICHLHSLQWSWHLISILRNTDGYCRYKPSQDITVINCIVSCLYNVFLAIFNCFFASTCITQNIKRVLLSRNFRHFIPITDI